MAPIIPSPTPITGIQDSDGRALHGIRLPLEELQEKHEFAFALYTQALLAWQKDGNEKKDSDPKGGTSYFQVMGIHGVPYVKWQEDPTKPVVSDAGYCTHRSVLFVPWHRPYLLLYEQIIYQYALEIVDNSTGWAKQAYENVLDHVRLPYWDFNKKSTLPKAVMEPTIKVTIPGESEGDKKEITLDHNPFYSYKFTSDYAWIVVADELQWALNRKIEGFENEPERNWIRESKRCPDINGKSRPEIASKQMETVGQDYMARAYSLVTSVQDFAEFTTQAYLGPAANADSVEVWHNFVHNYCGSEDADFQDFKHQPHSPDFDHAPTGNLTDVQGSSFDPLFWLLHCHIDRMTAIWQAINHDNTSIAERASYTPRATAAKGTPENGKSHLEPWHKSADHNTTDYWIANDTNELKSTFENGYYYPETPLKLRDDKVGMKKHVNEQINKIYAPDEVKERLQHPDPGRGPIRSVEWRAFVRIKSFAVPGTWGVHLFFGEPPSDSREWFKSDRRVGTVNVLSNSNVSKCPNCKSQAEDEQFVSGLVLLSNELDKRGIDFTDHRVVVKYLKENLTWRIAKDQTDVPITDAMKLLVGVAARDVSYPVEPAQLPIWFAPTVFPAATKGKKGGLQDGEGSLHVSKEGLD